jgi:hypothetical protein
MLRRDRESRCTSASYPHNPTAGGIAIVMYVACVAQHINVGVNVGRFGEAFDCVVQS